MVIAVDERVNVRNYKMILYRDVSIICSYSAEALAYFTRARDADFARLLNEDQLAGCRLSGSRDQAKGADVPRHSRALTLRANGAYAMLLG